MSFFLPSENWEKSHRFVCRFFCRPKIGKKVIGLYVVFFCRLKTVKKVIGLYVVFFCRRKTVKKVIGLYVVFILYDFNLSMFIIIIHWLPIGIK